MAQNNPQWSAWSRELQTLVVTNFLSACFSTIYWGMWSLEGGIFKKNQYKLNQKVSLCNTFWKLEYLWKEIPSFLKSGSPALFLQFFAEQVGILTLTIIWKSLIIDKFYWRSIKLMTHKNIYRFVNYSWLWQLWITEIVDIIIECWQKEFPWIN